MSLNVSLQSISLASDAEIIEKVLGGETAFFEILMRRYNAVLYRLGRSYGFNHQDTEDLMQECHVAAFFALKQFESRASYKTWLSKIMIHKCLYKLNHGHSRHEKPDSELIHNETGHQSTTTRPESTETLQLRKEFKQLLENALERLPVHYRTVFIMRAIEGFSVAETAALMNISQVNVKVRYSRSKALLQQLIEQYYSTTDIYEFHLRHCDRIVKAVFEQLNQRIS